MIWYIIQPNQMHLSKQQNFLIDYNGTGPLFYVMKICVSKNLMNGPDLMEHVNYDAMQL